MSLDILAPIKHFSNEIPYRYDIRYDVTDDIRTSDDSMDDIRTSDDSMDDIQTNDYVENDII